MIKKLILDLCDPSRETCEECEHLLVYLMLEELNMGNEKNSLEYLHFTWMMVSKMHNNNQGFLNIFEDTHLTINGIKLQVIHIYTFMSKEI